MKQFFKNILGKAYDLFKDNITPGKAYDLLKDNITPAVIGKGWVFISLFIVLFIFMLGVSAVALGLWEIFLWIYHYLLGVQDSDQDSDFLLVIVSVLKNLLLGFVLVILSKGIYKIVKKTIEKEDDEVEGIAEMNLQDIERNFIGIIILTMLVVVLGLILDHKNVNDVLYISAAISALIISLSFYIKYRAEGKEKVEEGKKEVEGKEKVEEGKKEVEGKEKVEEGKKP